MHHISIGGEGAKKEDVIRKIMLKMADMAWGDMGIVESGHTRVSGKAIPN